MPLDLPTTGPASAWRSDFAGGGFTARRTGSTQSLPASTNNTLIFNTVDRNFTGAAGDAYDPTTGLFTWPAEWNNRYMVFSAGIYYGGATLTSSNQCWIAVTGVQALARNNVFQNTHSLVLTGFPWQGTTGQTVQIRLFINASRTLAADDRCFFSGSLV